MARIVVLGAGIGGMSAAYELRGTLGQGPEITVIGGELAAAGGILTVPLEAAIERHSLHNPLTPPRVHISELGTDAPALGAAAYAIDTVFQAGVANQATA